MFFWVLMPWFHFPLLLTSDWPLPSAFSSTNPYISVSQPVVRDDGRGGQQVNSNKQKNKNKIK
jgi:hypothetical protein